MIADDKDKGIIDYVWALPISRICYVMADLTIWIAASLPGVIVWMVVGKYYCHMHYKLYSFIFWFRYIRAYLTIQLLIYQTIHR